MDGTKFDGLTRTIAQRLSRRLTFKALVAGLTAGTVSQLDVEPADAARCRKLGQTCRKRRGKPRPRCCAGSVCRGNRCQCKPGRQKCGNKCITKKQCCRNSDCPNNQRCDKKTNRCGCGKNRKRCQGRCIAKSQCCGDQECTGAQAGNCVNNRCQAAFETCTNEDAAIAFVKGPGNPPLSNGSVQFTVGPEPAVLDWAHLRFAEFAGTPLADIESLEYSVYVHPLDDESCPSINPYLALYVTADGDDHVMVSTNSRPNSTECNNWQTLDLAKAGNLWWSPTLPQDFAPLGDPKPLSEFIAEYPDIAIRNAETTDEQCPSALGGLRLEAGEWPGGGGTGDAVMNVSYLQVAITGKPTRTFRF